MAEPLKLTMGDTWTWTRAGGDYPASDGWSLTYYLALPGGAVKTLAATPSGADFTVTESAAATADVAKWAAGLYTWTARATKAGESHTVATGRLRVAPDPSAIAAPSTHAERCLAIIEAALERCLVSGDVVEYEIDGAKFKKNKTELVTLRNAYRQEIRRERGQLGMSLIPVSLR